MKDASNLMDDELDALLLAQAKANWQKVVLVIAKAMLKHENLDEERAGMRIAVLVQTGKLESAGNILRRRFSEVRLPLAT